MSRSVAEAAIRAARAASNAALATRDVPRITALMGGGYHASVASGACVPSAAAMGALLAARFAEAPDTLYVRAPREVRVGAAGDTAAEAGNWTGRWTAPDGRAVAVGGAYLASWRCAGGAWRLHSELFVPL